MNRIILVFITILVCWSCGQKESNTIEISTNYGDITVKLYDETPLHRDNFKRLVKDKFYDGVLFHRVINGFMIQGGDPTSKNAASDAMLGEGDCGEKVDAEFIDGLFHKKGVLAAAREGDMVNPERKSSCSQFYIVQGKVYTDEELNGYVNSVNERRKMMLYEQLKREHAEDFNKYQENNDTENLTKLTEQLSQTLDELFKKEQMTLSDEQFKAYTTIGGTPHLDGQYTVFGEVIEGLDVVDKIAAVETNRMDRPVSDVIIKSVRFK